MARAWKFGDNIDTDSILPGAYLSVLDEQELGKHCLETISKQFPKKVKTGDIVVAGKNFGCGSGRPAPKALKGAGVSCVIAESIARLFLRNSINYGFLIIECPEAASDIQDGDEITVHFDSGQIVNQTRGRSYCFRPFPDFIKKIIDRGGLLNFTLEELKNR